MTAVRRLAPLVLKDIHELGFIWLIAAGVLVASRIAGGPDVSIVVAAISVLGAVTMGYEFRHKTLETLLTQPVGRARLLGIKLSVLGAMIAMLVLLLWAMTPHVAGYLWPVGVAAAAALCLTPTLTVACRNELAGAIFSGGVVALLWLGAQVAAVLALGGGPESTPAIAAIRLAIFEGVFALSCALGAATGVYRFIRLEPGVGVESGARTGATAHTPARQRVRGALRLRHAYVALVAKELHLYGLPVAVGGLFAATWLVLAYLQRTALSALDIEGLSRSLSPLYIGVVTLLVGAVASAEERQLGVLSTEALLPLRARTRFAIKVASAGAVLSLLIVVLPWVLNTLTPGSPDSGLGGGMVARIWPTTWLRFRLTEVGAVVCTFGLSLYASSLVTGGLRALVAAIAGLLALGALVRPVTAWLPTVTRWLTDRLPMESDSWITKVLIDRYAFDDVESWMQTLVAIALVTAFVYYASLNHVSFESPSRRLRRQLPRLAALVAVAFALQVLVDSIVVRALDVRWHARLERDQGRK